jgi:hypothetical protein
VKPAPHRGDFITLEAPRERSAVAICVGQTAAGALRVRRVAVPPPDPRAGGHRRACFESIATYRGAWRPLAVTDPRHPAFDPTPDAALAELGL